MSLGKNKYKIIDATKRYLILFEQLCNQSLAVNYVGTAKYVCLSSLEQLFLILFWIVVHCREQIYAMLISKPPLAQNLFLDAISITYSSSLCQNVQ